MRVSSLAPLAHLKRLGSLFLTNLRVADGSLEPLHDLPVLQVLQCADFFRPEEMKALAHAKPGLRCDWSEKHSAS